MRMSSDLERLHFRDHLWRNQISSWYVDLGAQEKDSELRLTSVNMIAALLGNGMDWIIPRK